MWDRILTSANSISSVEILAIIGFFITVGGWFVNSYLTKRQDTAKARAEFIQRQIEELYGPLYGLIVETDVIFRIELQRQRSKPAGDSSHVVANRYFIETYYNPLNIEMVELIRRKMHLLVGGKLPESFERLMEHASSGMALYGLWRDRGIDSSPVKGIPWPDQFERDVRTALSGLQTEFETELRIRRMTRSIGMTSKKVNERSDRRG
jgi:hypothetical protein